MSPRRTELHHGAMTGIIELDNLTRQAQKPPPIDEHSYSEYVGTKLDARDLADGELSPINWRLATVMCGNPAGQPWARLSSIVAGLAPVKTVMRCE